MLTEMIFWLIVSTTVESTHDYAINGMIFAFFGTGFVAADCDWRKDFSNRGDGFSILYSLFDFLTK